MATIKELQRRAHQQSVDKGFHDNLPDKKNERAYLALNAERIALMHSELSEALEELRSNKKPNETYYAESDFSLTKKPEGVPSELADVVIRIMDFCGANEIDLEAIVLEKLDYNATRSHKHGGKSF